jgi:hypothetical protein
MINVFLTLTHQFFTHAHASDPSLMNSFIRAFKCLQADGLYDEKVFEDTLITHFGRDVKLFSSQYMQASGAKVGVTATTVRNASARIFTNYNGITTRAKDIGTSNRVPGLHFNANYQQDIASSGQYLLNMSPQYGKRTSRCAPVRIEY